MRLRPRQQLKARPEVSAADNLTPNTPKLVVLDEVQAAEKKPTTVDSTTANNSTTEHKTNLYNVKINGSSGETETLTTLMSGNPSDSDGKTKATVVQQNVNETHL